MNLAAGAEVAVGGTGVTPKGTLTAAEAFSRPTPTGAWTRDTLGLSSDLVTINATNTEAKREQVSTLSAFGGGPEFKMGSETTTTLRQQPYQVPEVEINQLMQGPFDGERVVTNRTVKMFAGDPAVPATETTKEFMEITASIGGQNLLYRTTSTIRDRDNIRDTTAVGTYRKTFGFRQNLATYESVHISTVASVTITKPNEQTAYGYSSSRSTAIGAQETVTARPSHQTARE